MGNEGAPTLTPAEPRLRGIAKEYGIAGVFYNPALAGTKTVARLLTRQDTPPVIELRPGSDYLTRLLAVLHECGHRIRDLEMADAPDYRLNAVAIRWYHSLRDAGHPPVPSFEDLYAEEERIVNSWAWGELMRHFGPRYGREEEYEARGFIFQHRDP